MMAIRRARAPRRARPRRASSSPRGGSDRSASARSPRPSSELVPSRRTTSGTSIAVFAEASMIPLAISSQRVMPPKMLNRIALTFVVGGDHLERVDDRVGLRAAPGVEEVRGLAARLSHHVERRHAEPGAVAEDADVAAELHVGEPLLLGHPLLRVLGGAIPKLGELLVPVQGAVVDRDLRVEGDDLAVRGDDQRVDLDQGRVLGDRDLVQLEQQLPDGGGHVLVDVGVDRELPRGLGGEAPRRARCGAERGPTDRPRRSPRCPSLPFATASPGASSRIGRGSPTRSTRRRSWTPPPPIPRGP